MAKKKLESFEECLAELLRIEDDYNGQPGDSCGPSRFGITSAVARANGYEGPMSLLPFTKARDIHLTQYWHPIQANSLPTALRYILFDSAVNHGAHQTVVWLQRALNITADGILGPRTLAAALAADPAQLKADVLAERLFFMANLSEWPRCSMGWARRMAEMMYSGDKHLWH